MEPVARVAPLELELVISVEQVECHFAIGEQVDEHFDDLIGALLVVILRLEYDGEEAVLVVAEAVQSAQDAPSLPRVLDAEHVVEQLHVRLELVRVVIGARPEELVDELRAEVHILPAQELDESHGVVLIGRLAQHLLHVAETLEEQLLELGRHLGAQSLWRRRRRRRRRRGWR